MRQTQALTVLLSGVNVFLTGPPGAGKTYVLNEFIRRARKKGRSVAVTASTGIAATHLNGTTIHSWSGLGIRDNLTAHDLEWLANNDKLRKRYNATDVLVIDEVSMLHGARLDMVNQACKLLRQNDQPFGGIQVVLVGDLFQLPPVSPGREVFDFAHRSAAWNELAPSSCYLSEQHRQAEDGLLELLTALRTGDFEESHYELLTSRMGHEPGEEVVITRLYTHNTDVDSINQRHLKGLDTQSKTYNMATKGAQPKVDQLIKSVLAPQLLQIKVGAEVMFVANNFAEGFVNGSRGQVISFRDNWPVVRLLDNDRLVTVEPHTWSLSEDGRVRAEVAQIPLRLAWAITIHKSQGMSLDAAEIDLSQAFTPGMGYVALSRVRSLDGVFLKGLNQNALLLHPEIYEFDRSLKLDSAGLSARTEDAPDEIESQDTTEEEYDEVLFEMLREWRADQARQQAIAPYMVAHDATLVELARRRPEAAAQLAAVRGMGPMKIEKYGPSLIALVTAHLKTLQN